MRTLATAEIIAVGSELLTPHRSDTNSLYLTARLNEVGINVRAKAIVGDDRADLAALFEQALSRADVVVMTGGLGPTDDDITREAVARVLGRSLHEDPEIVETIRARFARSRLPMPEINRRQAQVPEGAVVLPNPLGSAPGLWLDVGDRVAVLLPGPPHEMRTMFDTLVAPRLAERSGGRQLRRRVIKTTGRGESHVEELVQPAYATMREWEIPIDATILAAPGQIELHLCAQGSGAAVERALDDGVRLLETLLGSLAFSTDGRTLEAVAGEALRDRHWTVAVAESCTSGLLLGRLTEVPGSSAWVVGGVVAYANSVKIEQLGVPASLIEAHGAVSKPVAEAMADGVRQRLHADLGVGITGIAGPAGGTAAKPVGTVVIALTGALQRIETFHFPGDRRAIRLRATTAALDLIRLALESS